MAGKLIDIFQNCKCVKEEKHLAAGEVRSLAFGDNNTVMVVELGPVSYTHLDVYKRQGEIRTSNFLLWQSAYSEYYFTDVLWPDFKTTDLDAAIDNFNNRNRRFGGV